MPGGNSQVLTQLMDQRNKYLGSVPEDLSAKIWNVAAPAQATDPRDRVYALLGLMASPRAVDVPVTVDYKLAPEALFRNLTRRHLELGRDIGFLACSVSCRNQSGHDFSLKGAATKPQNDSKDNDENKDGLRPMPSWVWRPIQTSRDLSVNQLFAWDANGDNFGGFRASGVLPNTGQTVVFDDSVEGTHLLGLSGYEFDRISSTGPSIDPPGRGVQSDFIWASVAYGYMRWRQMAVGCREVPVEGDGKAEKRGCGEQRYVGTDESRLEAFRKIIQPVPTTPKGNLADDELAAIFKRFDAFMLRYFAFLQDDSLSVAMPGAATRQSWQLTKARWWSKRSTLEQQQQQQNQQPSQGQRQEQKIGPVDLVRYSLQLQRIAYMHKFNLGDARVIDLAFRILRGLNRRFCLTTKGYMALAPREARAGDSVVLLRGARAPFILRGNVSHGVDTGRTDTECVARELWKIVGDCRVHGIMNGEAWEESRCRRMWIN